MYPGTILDNDEVIGRVVPFTVQKMKFSIHDFFSKCDKIRNFLRIWSHLLKKSLMENFIFCAVQTHLLLFFLQDGVFAKLFFT